MNILSDILADLRKNRLFTFLLILQIIVTVYAVYQGVFYYFLETTTANESKIAYTDYSIRPLNVIFTNPDAQNLFYSPDSSEEDKRNVIKMYLELKKIDGLDVFYTTIDGTDSLCLEGDYTEIAEAEKKYDDPVVHINVVGDHTFSIFNISFTEKGFSEHFPIYLSAGEYFSESDFENGLNPDVIPVVAGYSFSKYFSVGDMFTVSDAAHGLKGKTLKIIGFLKEDYVCTDISGSALKSLDRLLIFPLSEISDEATEARRITSSFYLFDRNKEQEAMEKANAVIEKYGLSKMLYFREPADTQAIVNNYESNVGLRLASTILLLLFSLVSIAFMTINLLNENIRMYAIRMLVGATRKNIVTRIICSMSSVFLIGGVLGFLYYYAFPFELAHLFLGINGTINKEEWRRVLTVSPLFVLAFFVVALLLCILISEIKLKKSDLSSLIRDKEAKVTGKVPAYKLILGIMLAVISVFVVYVTSFFSYSRFSDMYYRHFYTENTEVVHVDLKEFGSDYEPYDYTGLADNYSIHRTVAQPLADNDSRLRGVYYHGAMELPNMISGRFFTEEEMTSDEYICVVGQKVWSDWTETDENGDRFVTYNNEKYKVIGVMGKNKEEITGLDYYTFIPFGTAVKEYSVLGPVVIDANTRAEVEAVTKTFTENLDEVFLSGHERFSATEVVPFVTDTFTLMLISALINCVVFGLYYIEKQKKKNTIKKMIGFSRTAVFADTLGAFAFLAFLAFIVGNLIMALVSGTVFSSVQLFKYYRLNIPVIVLSFSAIIAICCIFASISLVKTYRKDTSEFLR